MGKCLHEWKQVTVCRWKCKRCSKKVFISFGQYPTRPRWSPSIAGEATKEVRDWFAKEMPEEWEKYCDWIVNYKVDFLTYRYKKAEVLNAQLSIANLAQYIVDNYKEMFYEVCQADGNADEICPKCPNFNNWDCTGKTIIPRYAEVVEIIRRYLDGK